MRETVVLFDGFNLYHALVAKHGGQRPFERYKWIDYRQLALELLSPHEFLCEVYLFTTYTRRGMTAWRSKRRRHVALLDVQRDRGVVVVLGRFAERQRQCMVPKSKGGCEKTYIRYEEKRTDVNIAIELDHSL